ncbi:unnamed protein product [Oikopleura dioica]|uniref:Uncharacterized protein n=1 Tax=Oikopleura dioica TaxID=34765 RepID=E4X0L2_OIKDI|nr:unnamed protein product [Oikopleura dioica]
MVCGDKLGLSKLSVWTLLWRSKSYCALAVWIVSFLNGWLEKLPHKKRVCSSFLLTPFFVEILISRTFSEPSSLFF